MNGELPFFDPESVEEERDRAMAQVGTHAEERRPGFGEAAAAFVLAYLETHGASPGELITVECSEAGIRPHDDRAFGPVYMRLAREGLIEKVGTCRRERGHGTAGGNIWDLVK